MARFVLFYLPPTGRDANPISLGYICASLQARGISARIEDLTTGNPKTLAQIQSTINEERPDFAGFSGYQANMFEILKTARSLKEVRPQLITILGGPQAAFMPKDALREMPAIDILCRGEGERIAPEIVRAVETHASLAAVDGIVFRSDSMITETRAAGLTHDLDVFPSPYHFQAFNLSGHSIVAMLTSRGCPFSCRFCYTPNYFQNAVQYHSPERVLEDISVCVARDRRDIVFYDPSFTADRDRVKAIMRGIIDNGWELSLWCETRTDLVDRDLLVLMAEAGMKQIAYGLETINPSALRAANKQLDVDDFKRTIQITQDLGMGVEIFTLYALPRQTYEDALETVEFVKSLGVKLAGNSSGRQLSLYFGTEFTDNPEKFGIHVQGKPRALFLSPGVDFETDDMNAEEIRQLWKRLRYENMNARLSM